jgi:hypothetical protein
MNTPLLLLASLSRADAGRRDQTDAERSGSGQGGRGSGRRAEAPRPVAATNRSQLAQAEAPPVVLLMPSKQIFSANKAYTYRTHSGGADRVLTWCGLLLALRSALSAISGATPIRL